MQLKPEERPRGESPPGAFEERGGVRKGKRPICSKGDDDTRGISRHKTIQYDVRVHVIAFS